MARISETEVTEALKRVIDPCSASKGLNFNIVEMGLLDSVEINGSDVTITMRLTSPACHMVPFFINKVEQKVESVEGVRSATLRTDNGRQWDSSMMSATAIRKRSEYQKQLREAYSD